MTEAATPIWRPAPTNVRVMFDGGTEEPALMTYKGIEIQNGTFGAFHVWIANVWPGDKRIIGIHIGVLPAYTEVRIAVMS